MRCNAKRDLRIYSVSTGLGSCTHQWQAFWLKCQFGVMMMFLVIFLLLMDPMSKVDFRGKRDKVTSKLEEEKHI